jgi:hypothetical protein
VKGPGCAATDLGKRPWLVPRHARTLADLHNRLHRGSTQATSAHEAVQGDTHPVSSRPGSRSVAIISRTVSRTSLVSR